MGRVFAALRQSARSGGPAQRALWICALAALPLLVFVGVALLDHREQQRSGREHLLGTATALAEHAGSVFTAVDIALTQVEHAVGDGPLAGARGDRKVQQELQAVLGRMPALESLFLVDESGIVSASSRAFPMPPYDVQHRDYFQVARSGDDTLYVSVPFRGEFARSVSFTVSRRVVSPDGRFRGLVAASVFPEYFHALYRGVHLSSNRASVTLLRSDGTAILRFPDVRTDEGLSVSADVLTDAVRRQSGILTAAGTWGTGGDQVAFRVVPNTSLVLIYGARQSDMLAPWYGRLAGYGSLTLALSGLIALAGGYALFGRPGGEAQATAGPASVPLRIADYQARGAGLVLDAVRSCLGLLRPGVEGPSASPFLPPPAAILEGAGHGVTLAQRLIAPSPREKSTAKIVSVATSLRALSHLLAGSFWPPLEVAIVPGDDALDVFVEPEAFDLAVFDLASALKQVLPAGAALQVKGARESLRFAHPEGLQPGDYVTITFTAGETQPVQAATGQQARLRYVARFAHRSEGALVLPAGEIVTSATLWLPGALAPRAPKP